MDPYMSSPGAAAVATQVSSTPPPHIPAFGPVRVKRGLKAPMGPIAKRSTHQEKQDEAPEMKHTLWQEIPFKDGIIHDDPGLEESTANFVDLLE